MSYLYIGQNHYRWNARKLGERYWRNAARNRDSWQKLLKKALAQNGLLCRWWWWWLMMTMIDLFSLRLFTYILPSIRRKINDKLTVCDKLGRLMTQAVVAYYQCCDKQLQIPVAARSKAWVCGCHLQGLQGAWMSVCCECRVLSDRRLCVGLITRPEESYRVWCVWVWSWSLDNEALGH